jgi:RNA polymerase sigma factor (sigma-70 family)
MQPVSSWSHLEETPIGRLYQRHWQLLFTAIRRSISSREDAEDVLLEVFLAAVESKTLLSMSEAHQEAWLRRVTYNKCMDFHRRKRRHPTSLLEEHIETLFEDEYLAPEHIALYQEELVQLRKHLDILSTDQQEVLRLRFADGLRCAQIALRMRKSEGAIRSMLARALNRLRGIYTQNRKEKNHDETR